MCCSTTSVGTTLSTERVIKELRNCQLHADMLLHGINTVLNKKFVCIIWKYKLAFVKVTF